MNLFHRISRIVAVSILTVGLVLLPVGCTPPDVSVTPSASVNLQTGAPTIGVSVGFTWKHQPLQKISLFTPPPLSGSDLASLDTTQTILTYSLSNATIASTTGTVNIAVTDNTTGALLAQQNFAYDVRGNSLLAHDPASVSSWLQQFTSYSDLDVSVTASTDMANVNPGSASATASAVYQGVSFASTTASWTRNIVGGGGCHTRICPNQ